mmetsp:Transcript_23689/g.53877  ORF Transcript_23689/g.53877 Transcript_23689/m.53877 type:complete len:91 (-) Transcript_23689:99-371(-)
MATDNERVQRNVASEQAHIPSFRSGGRIDPCIAVCPAWFTLSSMPYLQQHALASIAPLKAAKSPLKAVRLAPITSDAGLCLRDVEFLSIL